MTTKAESEHMAAVAALGCLICRAPAEVHHIRTGYGAGQRASHYETLPLCPRHHRLGGPRVAFHACPDLWQAVHGSELMHLENVRRRLGKKRHAINPFFQQAEG